jgi:hypothetical protein
MKNIFKKEDDIKNNKIDGLIKQNEKLIKQNEEYKYKIKRLETDNN